MVWGNELIGDKEVASKWKYEGGVWSSVAFGVSRGCSGAAHPRSSLGDTWRVLVITQSPHYCTHRLGRELRNFRSGICVSKSVPIPVDLPG